MMFSDERLQLTIVLQVANWLLALSMEMYIPRFLDSAVDGEVLLTLDSALLKHITKHCFFNFRRLLKSNI